MNKPFVAVALLLCVALTGCSGGSPDDAAETSVKTVDYRGENLSCVKIGMAGGRAFTCDFDGFYAAHPDLLGDSKEATDVWWTTYESHALPCFKDGFANDTVLSCDWVWYTALSA